MRLERLGASKRNMSRGLRAFAGVLAALTLILSFAPQASADDLDDKKDAAEKQLAAAKAEVEKAGDALEAATAALAQSKTELATARADLAAKQSARDAAKAKDAELAAELKVAEAALTVAQAKVAAGKEAVAAQAKRAAATVQAANQQNIELLRISVIVTDFDLAAIGDRLQWVDTVFDNNAAEIERLRLAQLALEAAEKEATEAQEAVAKAKAEAEAHLAETQRLTNEAAAAEAVVAQQVSANASAEAAAATALADAQEQEKEDQATLASVEAEIQAAIEEAKRKAEEEAAKAAANGGTATSSDRPSDSGTFFLRPVQGRITSYFGYRIDPIAKVRRWHSGTDLGSPCGTPILAAEAGTVTLARWYGSYGNYTVIDHGMIDGNYWSTGYGHQSKIAVSVGQHVERGQVIGYVGTTGYSTGCHLHFNAFKNGSGVDGSAYF